MAIHSSWLANPQLYLERRRKCNYLYPADLRLVSVLILPWLLVSSDKLPPSGIMFSELAQNFKSFQSGSEPYKLRFYVGHDGSMIRLASGLGIGKNAPLRWPAMGSEIVLEVNPISSQHPRSWQLTRSGARKRRQTLCVWSTKERPFRICSG